MEEEKAELTDIQEPQQPTSEEQLGALQTQLNSLQAEKQKLEESYKGLQRNLSDREKKLGKQANLEGRIEELADRMELLTTAWASGAQTDTDLEGYRSDKDSVLKEVRKLRDEQAQRRKESETKVKQDEEFERYNQLWDRAKGFGTYEDNDQVAEIYDALTDGKPWKAERVLKKLEDKPKEDKVPEEDIEKKVDELLRQKMEEKGMLESSTGGPSAKSGKVYTTEEIHKMSPQEFDKLFPDGEAIQKAMKEGRFTD